jgi:flavin reductase (DIM6/NTAB) family NADH-FMN oxidoreductase RutF
MTLPPENFKRALSQFATGVCVVTGQEKNMRFGITISSFSSVSLSPPLILFSIDHRSKSHDFWTKARFFNVHILAQEQKELANRFASQSQDKWQDLPISESIDNQPCLEDCLARLECSNFSVYPGGDHSIILGQVSRVFIADEKAPLLYFRSRYPNFFEE